MLIVLTLMYHFSLLLLPILLQTQCNFVINRFATRLYIRILKYLTSQKNEFAGKTKLFIILYAFAGPDAVSIVPLDVLKKRLAMALSALV